jgi:predicted Zn-dependent protease
MRTRVLVSVLVCAAAAPLFSQRSPDPPVLHALREELVRSVAGLRMKDEPAPYYVAYSLVDMTETTCAATLGAPMERRSTRARILRADVRVGDYALDSSGFTAGGGRGAMGAMALLPIDDNEVALRRQVWLTTDAAYKTAVQIFSRKRAAFANRNDADPVPDMSREDPVDDIAAAGPAAPLAATWEGVVSEVSQATAAPGIVSSEVILAVTDGARYFINSEGFRTAVPARQVQLRVDAAALADDGMAVRDHVILAAQRVDDLPPKNELIRRARQMVADLSATRAAAVGDDYSGPVLVEDQAAATLVAHAFVPLFLARRPPESDDARTPRVPATPFLTRLGSRVLPESFVVKDTPSMTRYGTEPVGGAYTVDEEGVRAQDVRLVEGGRLVTLLTSRTPMKNLPRSNGHARGGGAQAGVFQMESASAVPSAALKTKYLELLKTQGRPFGYIVRGLSQFGGRAGSPITGIVKVTATGVEEPVRGLVLGNVTHTAFRDIVAASGDRALLTLNASGGVGSSVLVSVIVPSLIFEDLDIQRSKEPLQKRPTVPSPLEKR